MELSQLLNQKYMMEDVNLMVKRARHPDQISMYVQHAYPELFQAFNDLVCYTDKSGSMQVCQWPEYMLEQLEMDIEKAIKHS